MPTWNEIRGHLAPRYRFTDDEDRFLRLIVPLRDGERQQGVGLLEVERNDGTRLLSMNTPVAPLSSVDPLACLSFNMMATLGMLALTHIEDEPYIVLAHAILYSMLDVEGLDSVLEKFATTADTLEERLTEGEDLY